MLKSIHLSGFKSFAKRESLYFDCPVTAIVGPNGSGKSNIAEAFRFALGEQGPKAMRVKKGSDLIWGGSHSLPRSSKASVNIVLDNSCNKFKCGFDEVSIERIVFRDGANEYGINGSQVRLKDIQDLLAGANIGHLGHHIISQGDADRILNASARDRAELMEDALGLRIYRIKKKEALGKLIFVNLNLEKAESRKRELVPHLRFLKKRAERVMRVRETKKELKEKAVIYVFAEMNRIKGELNELREKISDLRAVKSGLETEMAELMQKRKESEGTLVRESDSQIDERIKSEKENLIKMRGILATLRTEEGKIKGRLEVLESLRKENIASNEDVISCSKVMEFIRDLLSLINERNIEVAKKFIEDFVALELNSRKSVNDNSSDFVKQSTVLKKTLRELKEQIEGQEKAIAECESKISNLHASISANSQREAEYERDIYKIRAQLSEVNAKLSDLERREKMAVDDKSFLRNNVSEIQILLGERLNIGLNRRINNGSRNVPDKREIERLKLILEQYGKPDESVLKEYEDAQRRYKFLDNEISDLKHTFSKISSLIKQLDYEIRNRFIKGVDSVNKEFGKLFNILFGGGTAKIILSTARINKGDHIANIGHVDDIVYSIDIVTQPPRKKVSALETLSGGERALTSIALIFAMSLVSPPPFVILDETDAALDEANSQRYANMIKELSKHSQMVLITHNRATMSVADKLYGVTMGSDGVSKLLSVQLREAQRYAKL